jgi:hypothetical protein
LRERSGWKGRGTNLGSQILALYLDAERLRLSKFAYLNVKRKSIRDVICPAPPPTVWAVPIHSLPFHPRIDKFT